MPLHFGDLTFDADRRALLSGDREVHLSPKAFRLLALLLERRPNAVSRTEIQEALWPETFVSDGSVAILVNELRRATLDRAREPTWIRTIHSYGYAFAGNVSESEGAPPLPHAHSVAWAGERMALGEGDNILGRDPAAAVVIGHPSVSRHHACIVVAGERAQLEDLRSKNGTWRGKQRVTGRVPLCDGDEVILGSATLIYRGPPLPATRETSTAP